MSAKTPEQVNLEERVRSIIKAPMRSSISTSDIAVGFMSSTLLSEKVHDLTNLIERETEIARLKGIQWYAYQLWRSFGNEPITDGRLKKMLDMTERELCLLSSAKAGDAN